MRRLDAELASIEKQIQTAVTASSTTLVELHGVGPAVAAVVLGHVHDVTRFRTRAQFASYNGARAAPAGIGPFAWGPLRAARLRIMRCSWPRRWQEPHQRLPLR